MPPKCFALDTAEKSKGRDVGNVVVLRKVGEELVDAVHDVTFAIEAFRPDGVWHVE